MDIKKALKLLPDIQQLTVAYYKCTGRPLGTTSEIAELLVCRILDLTLAEARCAGHDAIKNGIRFQIKSRRPKDPKKLGRVGSFSDCKDWDYAILVILSEHYEASEIYLADKSKLLKELNRPGSKARQERRALAVNQFKRAAGGKPIWTIKRGHIDTPKCLA